MNEETLFAEAIAIESPEKRRQFLDEACGENLKLRKSVEELLHLADNAGSFLKHPPVEAAADALKGIEPTIDFSDGSTDDDEGEADSSGQFEMRQNPQNPGDEISLGFLEPATREDSLGRLGHYEVLEVIGRGAFGIVLRAFDEKLQRVVAVKVLSPEMAAASPARKRFLREARTSAQIRHENVVSIYAVEDDPIPYLVMEYIPGKTLQQRLDEQGPLDPPDALRLGKQIADGLAAAHAEGLIHRDIKPANILLEGGMDERVKITDFGLARTADDASMTQSGVIAGTPMYMAPEQAQGAKLDQRADLFSFGSVLYQMLSGRPPFRAPNTIAVLKRVTEDTPRPIPEIIPEVPAWICELIGHLHAKNPEKRYGTARVVSELLAKCARELEAGRVPQIPDPSKSGDNSPDDLSEINSRRREPFLQSPLVKLAAALVIMLGLLGITEATGVTKFASTVIRLTTGSGTLVIETDDPGIQVTVRGDGDEVTIRGAGIEQLTLSPGKYRVAASKDGKPFKQELVTITRNGRTAVRMHLEPAAPPTPGADRSPSDDPAIHALLGASDEWEWSKPEPLTALNGAARDPCLALGDRLLLFASDRSGGLGRWDLWVSQRESRSALFSEPVNLGPTINTEDSEQMATMTEDGKILVFTSNRPGGLGGNDLWMSSRDSLEEPFSTPINLGEPINSRHHDSMPDLSSDGLQLVFGSERDGQFQVFMTRRTSRAEAFGPPVKLSEEVNLPGKRIWGPRLWQDGAVLLVRPDGLPISAAFWNSAQGKYGSLQPVAPPLDAGSAGTLSSDGREFYFQVVTGNYEYELYRSRLVRKHPAAGGSQPAIAPFTDADVERIAALPTAEQVVEVRRELMRRNPGFDGKVTPRIQDGAVVVLSLTTDHAPDISPVRALTRLQKLHAPGSGWDRGSLADLSPLKGLSLSELHVPDNQVSDLTALEGMPLEKIYLWHWLGSDLTPLEGMPLKWLNCGGGGQKFDLAPLAGLPLEFLCINITQVSDLAPLADTPLTTLMCSKTLVSDLTPVRGLRLQHLAIGHCKLSDLAPIQGMPLEHLEIDDTLVTDLSPLKGMSLEYVRLTPKNITRGLEILRDMKSLKTIGIDANQVWPVAEFWQRYDKGEFGAPSTDADVARIAALPAEQQIEEVRKELMRRNPGFDGELRSYDEPEPIVQDGTVIELRLCTDHVSDISPLRALQGLRKVYLSGSTDDRGQLSDLSPLKGMELTQVYLYENRNLTDLSPLRGMPITHLGLQGTNVAEIEVVREMPIQGLFMTRTPVSDLSPLAGKSLGRLVCNRSKVKTLRGLPVAGVKEIVCNLEQLPDKAELARLGVRTINNKPAAEFWKELDASGQLTALGEIATHLAENWSLQEMIRLGPEVDRLVAKGDLSEANAENAYKLAGAFGRGADWSRAGKLLDLYLERYPDDFWKWVDRQDVAAIAQHEVDLERSSRRIADLVKFSPGNNVYDRYVYNGACERLTSFEPNEQYLALVRRIEQQLAEKWPNEIEALHGRAAVRYAAGDIEACSELLERIPADAGHRLFQIRVRLLAAKCAAKNGDLDGAVQKLKDASELLKSQVSSGDLTHRYCWPYAGLLAQLREAEILIHGKAVTPPLTPQRLAELATVSKSPFTDADVERIAALPAAEQIEEVRQELMRRNPGFDGNVGHRIEDGVVTEIRVVTDHVTDISPLRVFNSLRVLNLEGTHITNNDLPGHGRLTDLTPLKGMNFANLEQLKLSWSKVGDEGLEAFQGCKNLNYLMLDGTQVTDAGLANFKDCKNLQQLFLQFTRKVGDEGVSHLKGCKNLKTVWLNGTRVTDAGMANFEGCDDLWQLHLWGTKVGNAGLAHFKDCTKLTHLYVHNTKVTDLSLLNRMPLEELYCDFEPDHDAEVLRSIKTLKTINDKPAAEFWKDMEQKQAADQAWLKKVEELPALEQVVEVRQELKRRNPKFNENSWNPTIENGVVTKLSFSTVHVTDITPVRALSHLSFLKMNGTGGRGALSDLSPLKGMNLTALELRNNNLSDLSPLRGMPLEILHLWLWVGDDLSPLEGMPLKWLNVGGSQKDLDLTPLAGTASLKYLCLNLTNVSDLTPLENMRLTGFECAKTRVSDLTPLRHMRLELLSVEGLQVTDLALLEGMPLKSLHCDLQQASRNAELLRGIKTLEKINEKPAAEFWKQIDAAMSSAKPPLDEAPLEEALAVVQPAIASKPVESRAMAEKPPADE
jgi:serine/threonine protein kinase/Leucine-rich repeat (LRR) protein